VLNVTLPAVNGLLIPLIVILLNSLVRILLPLTLIVIFGQVYTNTSALFVELDGELNVELDRELRVELNVVTGMLYEIEHEMLYLHLVLTVMLPA